MESEQLLHDVVTEGVRVKRAVPLSRHMMGLHALVCLRFRGPWDLVWLISCAQKYVHFHTGASECCFYRPLSLRQSNKCCTQDVLFPLALNLCDFKEQSSFNQLTLDVKHVKVEKTADCIVCH